MDRTLDHFELPAWQEPLPRRIHGGGRPPNRESTRRHGQELLQQAEEIANRLQARIQSARQGINPKLIFRLVLHPRGNLSAQQLSQMGLQVLAIDSRGAMVVFPNRPSLDELRRRLREYAGMEPEGHQYAYLASIEAINDLTALDRTGARLARYPLAPDEVIALDVELWHTGSYDECRANVDEISSYLSDLGLRVTDFYIGSSLCLLRAQMNQQALEELLRGERFDYVKEVDRRPEAGFELGDVIRIDLGELALAPVEAPDDLPGIVLVDSGIAQGHPLLAPVLGDAQVFPDRLGAQPMGGPEDGDQRTGGHGTAVAGIAAYGDVGHCIEDRSFDPAALLFSARVTDENNEYDEEELLEHQLVRAIQYFVENYPTVKVINISLGDSNLVYSEGRYQFRFAAVIDDLAFRYRHREIIFVVPTGNYFPEDMDADAIVNAYPGYLLAHEQARLISPGTAALAVTVGGLSYGAGRDVARSQDDRVDRLVAGERGWPSPFTRTGWGLGGAIKPDFVEFAGDFRYERGRIPARQPSYAGLPTTAKDFAPPEGRLFRTVAGTSFAAPRIANLASRLFRDFPAASSNLIRALMADSARVPGNKPVALTNCRDQDDDILRTYGYGQPDFARARSSALNHALLLHEGALAIDSFRLFLIPSLPDNFLQSEGRGYIAVSLAFDPPTRHTRADSYLGVTMDFDVFRNVSPELVANALRSWQRDEREELEDADLPSLGTLGQLAGLPVRVGQQLKPGANRRRKGALQRAVLPLSRSNWRYDQGPLVLAVVCQRKWAPDELSYQRFAVVVSLYHENPEVAVYAHVREQARLFQRVRVRV